MSRPYEQRRAQFETELIEKHDKWRGMLPKEITSPHKNPVLFRSMNLPMSPVKTSSTFKQPKSPRTSPGGNSTSSSSGGSLERSRDALPPVTYVRSHVIPSRRNFANMTSQQLAAFYTSYTAAPSTATSTKKETGRLF